MKILIIILIILLYTFLGILSGKLMYKIDAKKESISEAEATGCVCGVFWPIWLVVSIMTIWAKKILRSNFCDSLIEYLEKYL